MTRPSPPLRPDRQRILIIKPSALGDIATALPLLCDLKRTYPNADIDWLVHPAFTALLQGHDALHDIIPFDRKKLSSWWWKPSAFKQFFALLKQLRQKKYHLVIDAQGLFRSAFLARVTRAQIRIGFADAREGAPLFYTKKVTLPKHGTQTLAVDRMRALLQPLDIPTHAPAQFRIPISPTARQSANNLLQTSSFNLQTSYVALIPGARWNTKRWPIDRYTQIAEKILATNTPIILLGSPDEKPLCDQIKQQLETRNPKLETLLNLAGKTDLPTLIALLDAAKLIIANDSGPLHIAAALAKPVIALYGPTSPDHVGPYAQLDQVIRHDVPCHPCRRRECDHHSCMNGLTVELVWERTAKTLAQVPS